MNELFYFAFCTKLSQNVHVSLFLFSIERTNETNTHIDFYYNDADFTGSLENIKQKAPSDN